MPILIAILLAAGLSGCVAYAETTRVEVRVPPPDDVIVYEDDAGDDRGRRPAPVTRQRSPSDAR